MKKIGIVTWYKNGNYGGTLQAYALASVIEKLGYFPEFIDYNTGNIFTEKIRHLVFDFLYRKSGASRRRIWKFVRTELHESVLLNSYTKLISYSKDEYSAVVCGSDQIWSCLDGVNPFYFNQFIAEEKRVAYAPSIGVNDIKPEFEDEFRKYVSSISFLSVREERGADCIRKISGKTADVVLDPTLLLDGKTWKTLSAKSEVNEMTDKKGKYILCYFLGDDERYKLFVDALVQQTGFEVLNISTLRKNYGKSQVVCNPLEFVNLIVNAAYVLTDSFHGTVISINVGTRVGVFLRFNENDEKNQNSRIYSILSLLGLESLLVSSDDSVECFEKKEFYPKALCERLTELRSYSIQYLSNALKKASE